MIKGLRKLNDWLLLVKELVAHWGPYQWQCRHFSYTVRCVSQESKSESHKNGSVTSLQ